MPWFAARNDLPLAGDPTSRFLAAITGLMVFLAVLALAGALVAADIGRRWDSGLAGGLTVQVTPPAVEQGAMPLSQRVDAALWVLRSTPGVMTATLVPPDRLSHLMEPWLGPEAAHDPLLPLPVLIDVTAEGPLALAPLRARLAATAPGILVDDHARWLADIHRLAMAVELLALGIVGLVGGAAAIAVIFSVRAGLAIHRSVVELLHIMGATDGYVSGQFESHVLHLSLRGGAVGLALAATTLVSVGRLSLELRLTLLPDVTLSTAQWLALVAVPGLSTLLATATTRWTVLRALRSLP
jgi:cell division transport system permease protein